MSTTTINQRSRWWFDALAVIKAGKDDTNGTLTVVEVTEPPHAQAPPHVHYREDEAFYVLEGSVTIMVGDDTVVDLTPGDFAFGPRNVPHRYVVGPEGCRMLFICTPAGFEELVTDMSEPATAATLPPQGRPEPDWGHVARTAEAHGCKLLG